MKPAFKLDFSDNEKKIIKNVSICSVVVCLIVVGGSYFYNSRRIKTATPVVTITQENTLGPLDIEAHQFIAHKQLQNGNPKKAIPHLQRILFYDKKDINNQINLAHAFLEAGQYQSALDLYNSIEAEELSDSILASLCTRKGVALYYTGRKEESKTVLNQCLSQYPQSAEALCFLGQIEAASGADSNKVIDTFEKAIQIDSNYVEAWYQLARYWMQLGKHFKAREHLLRVLQIDPLQAKSHARLGMIYYYMGNIELSRISYQTAIAINPTDYNTHYNLGELYYTRLSDTVNALKEFKSAIEEKPDHVEANFKIGLICMKNNMVKEAIHYFEKALTLESHNTRILLQLAVALERIQHKEQAKAVYERILSTDELNSIARQKLKILNAQE